MFHQAAMVYARGFHAKSAFSRRSERGWLIYGTCREEVSFYEEMSRSHKGLLIRVIVSGLSER
jgi:hypothetical protein